MWVGYAGEVGGVGKRDGAGLPSLWNFFRPMKMETSSSSTSEWSLEESSVEICLKRVEL